jgi:hypothetical protein
MTKDLLSPTELAAARREVEQSIPILQQIQKLQVKDANTYAQASALLVQICTIRGAIVQRFEHILDPLNAARKAALELRKDLDKGPAEAEDDIRYKMREYKSEEAKRLAAAESQRRQEEEGLRQQAEEAKRKEDQAKTKQMKERLAQKRAELEAEAELKKVEKVAEPVKVAGSTTRTITKARVISPLLFISGLEHGDIPMEIIDWEETGRRLTRLLKEARPAVEKWPGVEIYTELEVVRR